MASVVTLPFTLTAPPAGYTPPTKSKLTPSIQLPIYPAGPSFIRHAKRSILQQSFAEEDAELEAAAAEHAAKAREEAAGELFPGLGEEVESKETLACDPKEWKKQDHYAILGLGHLRYKATDEHIKVAQRRKVLRHHPDKKAGANGAGDDAFFKCIQKAYETLTNSERRRQFDSVDWNIEDEVPPLKTIPSEIFCDTLAPVFSREARFSKVQPVPAFGGNDASKKEVEGFYDFWYNFDSWRSFEWYDKEVNEGSDTRDDKRFTEKKNKSERARRKKEDNTRLRQLVDDVLALDPRIKRIKQEEKAARAAKKKSSGTSTPTSAVKPLTPAQKKATDEAAKKEAAKNAAPELSKAEKEAAKKAKEAARKNLKKWKKTIAGVIAESNYFQAEGVAPSASVIEKQLAELDTLCELLEPEEVKDLKEKVDKAGKGEATKEVLKAKASGLGDKGAGKFTEFA